MIVLDFEKCFADESAEAKAKTREARKCLIFECGLALKILEKLVFIDSAESKMKYTNQALPILVAAVGLCSLTPQTGCTWGYKQATIPSRYPPVPSEQVEILS